MRAWFTDDATAECACRPSHEGDRLVVDATDCPGEGRLAEAPACREAVVGALTDRDADAIHTHTAGRERAYLDGAAALLVAAGRFADRVAVHDERLAERAHREPVAAATEAGGRADPVARIAAETGLAAAAEQFSEVADVVAHVGPAVGHARVATDPPAGARLIDTTSLSTGSSVRRYAVEDGLPVYHLEPLAGTLSDDAMATLARAREYLASGACGGDRAAREAVVRVADDDAPVERLGTVLQRHTADFGVLVDLFADPAVSDVFATAPVTETPLRVRADGDLHRTNVRLGEAGAAALASQFRLRSGRAFSRASPTLDATVEVGDRRVRVAGTTDPVSDGYAFAFRAHDRERWTLDRLVETETVTPAAAAVCSLAVERGAATLLAGTRGAGKTTTLGAMLWELPRSVRTLVIEDTPELPVDRLRGAGRDVQAMHTATGDGPGLAPDEAMRAALRLGEGALVVGEVRGSEASVLYEAMRVGAGASAVLGTIHGDGGADVRERVVTDMGVPDSSFAATDLVVTLAPPDAERGRRVTDVEEVIEGERTRFASLFERTEAGLEPTGRIQRGNSRLVESLRRADERYADLREALAERATRFGHGEVSAWA